MADIIDVLLNHTIEKIYRIIPYSPDELITNEKIYRLHAENKKCRIFELSSDEVSEDDSDGYRENSEYEQEFIEMISKYDLRIGDVIMVQHEVVRKPFVVKKIEFLSLEPLVSLFKNYQYILIPYSGVIKLEDGSRIYLYPEFIGGDFSS